MKKIIAILSAAMIVIGFAGCSDKTQIENNTSEANQEVVSVADIMSQIKDEGYLPEDSYELTADDMLDYYGIESTEIKQQSVVMSQSGYQQDEFIIIEATDSKAADDIVDHLNNHIKQQCDQARDYNADMYDVVTKCEVITYNNYIALFITTDYEELNSIFNSYFA